MPPFLLPVPVDKMIGLAEYYKKHGALINRFEDLFEGEEDKVWAELKAQGSEEDFDLQKVKKATYIHEKVIKRII